MGWRVVGNLEIISTTCPGRDARAFHSLCAGIRTEREVDLMQHSLLHCLHLRFSGDLASEQQPEKALGKRLIATLGLGELLLAGTITALRKFKKRKGERRKLRAGRVRGIGFPRGDQAGKSRSQGR